MDESGLAMWSDTLIEVSLRKGDRGLGFSILDYQVIDNNIHRLGWHTMCKVMLLIIYISRSI